MSTEYAINQVELADRLDHDFELFIELAELFFEDSQSLLQKVKCSIDENDPDSLRKSAHTLKGAVSNFSATSAYDAAYELEMAGKENRLSDAPGLYDKLVEEIDNVTIEMKKMIETDNF